ncbi:MAG: YcgL domain-containing protein [Gammaproteobacteria bacterium]
MKCAIYKSLKKMDTYLYMEREDDFSRVPETLLKLLGQLQLVMNIELTPERNLAQANPEEVRQQLQAQGYYLQLPPIEPMLNVRH